jgi:hypothetical protein
VALEVRGLLTMMFGAYMHAVRRDLLVACFGEVY